MVVICRRAPSKAIRATVGRRTTFVDKARREDTGEAGGASPELVTGSPYSQGRPATKEAATKAASTTSSIRTGAEYVHFGIRFTSLRLPRRVTGFTPVCLRASQSSHSFVVNR